jgi:hypothetical protein
VEEQLLKKHPSEILRIFAVEEATEVLGGQQIAAMIVQTLLQEYGAY